MTISIPGVDYSWDRPGGPALAAAGKAFACRYLSHDPAKSLTNAEAAELAAHGVSSVVVWESDASRALGGKTAGVADAKTAQAQAIAAGMPDDRPIYFAVDFDATTAEQTPINAYLKGAASVLGLARTGVYGGYYVVSRALNSGVCSWAWQTGAWSGSLWDPRAAIRQGASAHIAGASVDLNTAVCADYGQWTPGRSPAVRPVVDLSNLVAAAKADPSAPQGHGLHPADVRPVEAALRAEGLLSATYSGDGSFGSLTVTAYAAWQRRCGYTGDDADGVPGLATLTQLGKAHGFDVAP